jgi:hypothetical protein
VKKLSVLSVPLIGLAGLAVWTQTLAGVPADQPAGVVVVDPVRQGTVPKASDASSSAELAPRSTPRTTAEATSPSLKTAPLNSAASSTSAPDAVGSATAPQPVEMAQTQATDLPAELGSSGDDPGVVQRVEPTQVTSPAVAPTGNSTSQVQPDDKGGLDGSGGNGDE